MPANFVTSTYYPAVRSALDQSVDEVILPDDTIAQDLYIASAEAEVKDRDPKWAERTGTDATRLINAAVYLVAARIAPSMTDIIAETLGENQSYSRKAMDWPQRAEQLRNAASRELNAVLNAGSKTAQRPTLFSRAPGGRGA